LDLYSSAATTDFLYATRGAAPEPVLRESISARLALTCVWRGL
jgi:hypothetical protein